MSHDMLPSHVITPGRLQNAYRSSLDQLLASDSLRRLWAKDVTLWPADRRTRNILTSTLAWLDLPGCLSRHLNRITEIADAAQCEGFLDVVFVATADADFALAAAEHPSADLRWRRVFCLDTINPSAIRAVDEQLDFARTLFVIANKSGKRLETHSLFLYFLDRLKSQGAADPGRCFVAVTEEDSYLADHAVSYGFRAVLFDPAGIPARYSSILHFGLLLAGLWRFDPALLAARAVAIRELCQLQSPPENNPALTLAALIAAGARNAHDKLLLLSTQGVQAASRRIAHLLSGGIGCAAPPLMGFSGSHRSVEAYQKDAIAVTLAMAGDDDAALQESAFRLIDQGAPSVSIKLQTPADLGGSAFVWQVATALACSLLEANPFDAPRGSPRPVGVVESLAARHELPVCKPRAREKGLELYAEGETRLQISMLSFAEALRTFFELRAGNDYLSVISFLNDGQPQTHTALDGLRQALEMALEMPVLLTTGPRQPCDDGQREKRGPAKGLVLILTAEPVADVPIPGAGYSFGQLQLALAIADFEAWQLHSHPVVRLHLTAGVASGVPELQRLVHQALSNIRVLAR